MTLPSNSIEARESTIGNIFSDEFAFEIPPYQRPYAERSDRTMSMTRGDSLYATRPTIATDPVRPTRLLVFAGMAPRPVYWYNLRLASYYDARADAFTLMETKPKSVGFSRLTMALTPALDFGKAPPTPIEQLIELLQQIDQRKKPSAKED